MIQPVAARNGEQVPEVVVGLVEGQRTSEVVRSQSVVRMFELTEGRWSLESMANVQTLGHVVFHVSSWAPARAGHGQEQ
jgi:hypothetical protein